MEDEITIIVKRNAQRKKNIGLEITKDCKVVVRAPQFVSNEEINKVLAEKKEWIIESIRKMKWKAKIDENKPKIEKLTMEEMNALAEKAMVVIPEKAKKFAAVIGVTYGRITIRNQRSRWGSCSSKGNLNFNVLLMLMPEFVQDYVVVHELCHRKEMNHSPAFYREVQKVLPNYEEAEKWVKKYGNEIMQKNI